jgi:hypothetical protein
MTMRPGLGNEHLHPPGARLRSDSLGFEQRLVGQYASALGKNANCQTLVSLTLGRGEVPVMVARLDQS